MTFDSLVNAGEYFSAHYLAVILPKDIRRSPLPAWAAEEKAGQPSPRTRLRRLRSDFFDLRADVDVRTTQGSTAPLDTARRKYLGELHDRVLDAFGFTAAPAMHVVEHNGAEYSVPVRYAGRGVVAVGCGWATEVDDALDPEGAGLLPEPVPLAAGRELTTGAELATFLFGAENPPRYVLLVVGGVLILADRHAWGEGRYLGVSLDAALGRNDRSHGGELDTIAVLFSAEALHSPSDGGENPLAQLIDASHRHAVGVSAKLRDGLRESVELVANEVLNRLREAGVCPEDVDSPGNLARRLTRESLRYLYRILFLLYAEARPDLGILPADYPEYAEGYSLGRLGELVVDPLVDESAATGFHLYESLDLLFGLVNSGHRPRRMGEQIGSEDEGIRFESLHSDLLAPGSITLIGALQHPGWDPDEPDGPPCQVDTRLRNGCLRSVLRLLMLAPGDRKERGGFISYAQLSINEIGAVYEGLMSYSGSIADQELYEVARAGKPEDGSWTIPATRADAYPDNVFVTEEIQGTTKRRRVRHQAGSFVYRMASRERQTTASYYTPESLTKVTVRLALQQRLADGGPLRARDLLDWTICEPALGSGAFLNEAINQVAAEYLRMAQEEATKAGRETIPPERYENELRKAKAYIALHNSYGVDLNPTAVELAEVSLWLNVMHPGLEAPWFGLHLRRGNSLIGATRRYYLDKDLSDGGWLRSKGSVRPIDHPLRLGELPDGAVHQFLLPAAAWGAVAGKANFRNEAHHLAPDDTLRLAAWRRGVRRKPTTKQVQQLRTLARRVEHLWSLVVRRLEISQREISRHIDVWGAPELPHPTEAVPRQKVLDDLHAPGTPYWRLRTLMDAWCALWFWPAPHADLLDGSAAAYRTEADSRSSAVAPVPAHGTPALVQDTLDGGEGSAPQRARTTSRRSGSASRAAPRPFVPLASLDDWIEFAEALLGRADVTDGTLGVHATTLSELDVLEDQLPVWMVSDPPHRLPTRFPWLTVVEEIAAEQGFFHWELDFAHVFAGPAGGFELQLGNPPWFRPLWDAKAVFAEHEPWFGLEKDRAEDEKAQRRAEVLRRPGVIGQVLAELTTISAQVAFFSSPQVYPLIAGTQPNLYRGFMSQVWAHSSMTGHTGLVHPDTHFTGDNEEAIREEAYQRLRMHGDFVNAGQRFFPPPVGHASHFGVHIYGPPGEIHFDHLSWLVSADALLLSRQHDGSDEVPGIRYRNREFDERPHRTRVIPVDGHVLATWQRLLDQEDQPVTRARLLFPVSTAEAAAIEALATYPLRLAVLEPQISRGFNESAAKKSMLIETNRVDPATGAEYQPAGWHEVILKGVQLGLGTSVFKRHDANSNDPHGIDLVDLPVDFVPDTKYLQVRGREGDFRDAHVRWIDHATLARLRSDDAAVAQATSRIAAVERVRQAEVKPAQVDALLTEESRRPSVDFYRLAWRRRVASDTERALYVALIPPTMAHVHGVHSLTMPGVRLTALVAGFWASIPLDYFVRATGREDLQFAGARAMPAPSGDHPLASALLLRTLRLNCLTTAYADLWAELFDPAWHDGEVWACAWPGLPPLQAVTADWRPDTPLRTERARRAALVEIDALVAVWLGMDADALVAAYRGRFPVLQKYEDVTWFDAHGWKLAGNARAFGQRQTKETWPQFEKYQQDEGTAQPPDGYTPPFHKADREREMREAHAVFTRRLAEGGRQ